MCHFLLASRGDGCRNALVDEVAGVVGSDYQLHRARIVAVFNATRCDHALQLAVVMIHRRQMCMRVTHCLPKEHFS